MNKVIIIGRMTRPAEIRYTNDQKKVATFTLAVDGYNRTDFIDCVTFNRADFIEKYGDKGLKLAVTGALQVDNYKDKNGNNRKSVRVMVNDTEFVEKKQSNGTGATSAPDPNEFYPIDDGEIEELPFM